MLATWTLALLVAASTPFEDTQHRFHLQLPTGWRFAPQPGDTGGATFRRESDGVFVNATVRVMPVNEAIALSTFVDTIAQASIGESGYRLLREEKCQVDGHPGVCRRYLALVNGDPRLPKMAEQSITLVERTGYVLHAETLADAFPLFEADVLALHRSFHLGAAEVPTTKRRHLRLSDVLGNWRSQSGEWRLELTRSGSITLNDAHGTYRFDQGTLVANLADTTAVLTYALQGGVLTLAGGPLGKGQRFVRVQKPEATPSAGRGREKKRRQVGN